MDQTGLVFWQTPVTGNPVALVFGDDGTPDTQTYSASAVGSISGLAGVIQTRCGVRIACAGSISGLAGGINARIDLNVDRPTVCRTVSVAQHAQPISIAARTADQQAAPLRPGVVCKQQQAAPISASTQDREQQTLTLRTAAFAAYSEAIGLSPWARAVLFEDAGRLRARSAEAEQQAYRLRDVRTARFEDARRLRHDRRSRFEDAAPRRSAHHGSAGYSIQWRMPRGGRYQEAWPPRPGVSAAPQPPAPTLQPCYTPAIPAHLLFRQSADATLPAHLLFICDGDTEPAAPVSQVVVPVRRVYIVLNNVSLVRVSDNLALPVISMSLSLDINSWTWGWDAQMPASAETMVSPTAMLTPVELEASVNGFAVRLLAEGISRERRFGAATIRVTGRGKSALLAAPYAPVINYMQASTFTAQQLMADVLTANGVGIGWGIDWGLTDWSVPSGVFAFQGSWMDGLVKIAQAAGGYVHQHPTAQTLRVRPRYPLPPWQWGTLAADVVLPADAVEQESIQWVDRPIYNRVFVRGEAQGILGQVTRTGTAGDLLSPMVVDPLITHADAARQRGIAVLSDTGRKLELSLRLPVAADMGGLLEPGKVISYQDGSATRKGIVRSVKVDASFPNVWQTIGVEAFA
jgi:hypothetical protein